MAYGTVNADIITTSTGQSIGAGDSTAFKNRIINGGMVIAQRGTSAATPPSGWGYSTIDRLGSWAGDASNWTIQQSSSAPAGFNNSALITVTSALSVTSGTYDTIAQNIEGVNCADLMWGTANAKTCTFSFWVNCSLAGTFTGYVYNNGYSYNYPFTYTISAANTWTYITITVPGPTSGTWLSNTNIGFQVGLTLASGSTWQGTANTWQSGYYKIGVAGTVNVLATNGATFYTTGWQFEVGTQATSFDYRDYGRELIMCQRYYAKSYNQSVAAGSSADEGGLHVMSWGDGNAAGFVFPVSMRAAPTVTLYPTHSTLAGYVNSAGTDRAAAGVYIGEREVSYIGITSGTANNYVRFQYLASAEL